MVVLYIDGVVAEHERPLDVTMEDLCRAAGGRWDSAGALRDALIGRALGDRPPQDDLAILGLPDLVR